MLIELLYELFGDISPTYIYLCVAFSVSCSFQLMGINLKETIRENHVHTKAAHSFTCSRLPNQKPLGVSQQVQRWLAHTVKRIDAPDDDTDNHSFSLSLNQSKRGGQQCKAILYSHSLKNIVSLVSY